MPSIKQKDQMSSFDLAAIVVELREVLTGKRISNIYQITPITFIFSIQSDHQLLIELGRRIHLSKYVMKKPRVPSTFCRILRKHLRRGIINMVTIPDFERIMILTIVTKNDTYYLVLELFAKGNLLLLDHEHKILYASSYRKMRDRTLLREQHYHLPPPHGTDPTKIRRSDLDQIDGQQTIVQALSNILAVGRLYVEEVLLRAQIEKERIVKSIDGKELDRIYDVIQDLTLNLSTSHLPQIIEDRTGRFIDVVPFPLLLYREYISREYKTFNEAVDEYFIKVGYEVDKTQVQQKKNLRLDEQRRILQSQQKSLKTFIDTSSEKQRIGDLIYAHAREFELLSKFVLDASKQHSPKNRYVLVKKKEISVLQTNLLQSIDPQRGVYTVEVEDVSFEMNYRNSVYENAAQFYEDAKKIREKITGVQDAIVKTRKRMDILERHDFLTEERLDEPKRRRKKRWYEKFHWFHSHQGFLILGGRDAYTNELLIKKHLNPHDLVLHADIPGAPFVVIITEGKTASQQTLREAAQCAVSYSSAWKRGYTSLDAYWVKPEQVSKSAPSGEYLPRGAFMIHGQKNYLRHIPLRIAIGIMLEHDQWTILGGPPSAISSHTKYTIEIVPGRQKSGQLAKKIRHSLLERVPSSLNLTIHQILLEEIQPFIPGGGGEVSFR